MEMFYRGRKVTVISIKQDGTSIVKDSKPKHIRMNGDNDYPMMIVKTEQLKPIQE